MGQTMARPTIVDISISDVHTHNILCMSSEIMINMTTPGQNQNDAKVNGTLTKLLKLAHTHTRSAENLP